MILSGAFFQVIAFWTLEDADNAPPLVDSHYQSRHLQWGLIQPESDQSVLVNSSDAA